MDFLKGISASYINAVKACFQLEIEQQDLSINETRKDFNGDFTFVIFPLVKQLKKSPLEIGNTLGNWLIVNEPKIVGFETIQGFLNVTLSDKFWLDALKLITETLAFGTQPANNKKVLVEFSSPNTNKPLH